MNDKIPFETTCSTSPSPAVELVSPVLDAEQRGRLIAKTTRAPPHIRTRSTSAAYLREASCSAFRSASLQSEQC